ncbi:MAG: DUF393 domain-containing protein [Parachlamydiaceae bacterium]|nr:DUF393 domain-containing protein [Parachlamydiaceae bacterium]
MPKHLVFYDGKCGLCDQAVQFIIRQDIQEQFVFAPLQGITAKVKLETLPSSVKNEDSLILIENYQSTQPEITILGRGALRICWLLGGMLSILGLFSWLPSSCVDWAYKIVARNRHRFFSNDQCVLPTPQSRHRFLP